MPKNKRPRKKYVATKAADTATDQPKANKAAPQKTYGVPKSPRSSISPIMNRNAPRGR